jgi:hypothetical protein
VQCVFDPVGVRGVAGGFGCDGLYTFVGSSVFLSGSGGNGIKESIITAAIIIIAAITNMAITVVFAIKIPPGKILNCLNFLTETVCIIIYGSRLLFFMDNHSFRVFLILL